MLGNELIQQLEPHSFHCDCTQQIELAVPLDSVVDIWHLRIADICEKNVQYEMLAAGENLRMRSFRNASDRDCYARTRIALRILLAYYMGCSPRSIAIHYGTAGKPYIQTQESQGLRFNVSHSNGNALIAFAVGREVGVDLEYLCPITDIDSLCSNVCCPSECQQLMQLSPKKRRRAFFQCWSRKEACLKALGVGLQLPFTTFSVPFTANVTSEIVHIPNVPITEYINLSSIHMEGNFSAAVAVLGAASVRINMLHFKEEFFSSI